MRKNPKKNLRRTAELFLSIFIAVALAIWVLRQADAHDVLEKIRNADLIKVTAAFGALTAYQVLRAVRLRRILSLRQSTGRVFETVCLQGAINNILPASLGEVAMVALLKKLHGVGVGAGIASVVAARILDLASFVVVFALVFFATGETVPLGVLGVMAAVAFAAVTGLGLVYLASPAQRWVKKWPAGRVKKTAVSLLESFTQVRAILFKPCGFAALFLLTTALWVFMYLFYLGLAQAVGAGLSPLQVLCLFLLLFPLDLLPVKGFANIGTFQAAWLGGSYVLGLPAAGAAAAGFGVHAWILVCMTLLVIFPFAAFFVRRVAR